MTPAGSSNSASVVQSNVMHSRTRRALVALAVSAVALGGGAEWTRAAQAPDAATDSPRFEVASVKPHRSADDVMFALQFHDGGRFTATGTLRMLIRTAYRLQESQLVGGPAWIDADLFDVVAKAEGAPTPAVMLLMLRQLLADRFALRVRDENRNMPVYALGVARSGGTRGAGLGPAGVDCGRPPCNVQFAPGTLTASGVTMAELATNLSMWVDRIVTDQTGLGGRFDVNLRWTPDRLPQIPTPAWTSDRPAIDAADPNGPSIFTALREQLGLELDARRGTANVLVVDRAEKPTGD
jgi:uncharacterized protein (TIGR03435 family)